MEPRAGAKGMVQTDERRGLRHAVALHNRVTDALKEFLGVGGVAPHRAGQTPELPAEFPVNSAKPPGTPQKLLAVCRAQIS